MKESSEVKDATGPVYTSACKKAWKPLDRRMTHTYLQPKLPRPDTTRTHNLLLPSHKSTKQAAICFNGALTPSICTSPPHPKHSRRAEGKNHRQVASFFTATGVPAGQNPSIYSCQPHPYHRQISKKLLFLCYFRVHLN